MTRTVTIMLRRSSAVAEMNSIQESIAFLQRSCPIFATFVSLPRHWTSSRIATPAAPSSAAAAAASSRPPRHTDYYYYNQHHCSGVDDDSLSDLRRRRRRQFWSRITAVTARRGGSAVYYNTPTLPQCTSVRLLSTVIILYYIKRVSDGLHAATTER